MKLAKYLPVNIDCENAFIYTTTTSYPIKLLKHAYQYVMGDMSDRNVILNKGTITFLSNPEYNWTLPEVVAAYNFYKIAKNNDFSFYPIYSEVTGGLLALVSSSVRGARFIYMCINDTCMELRRKQYYSHFTKLINRKCDPIEFYNLFQTYSDHIQHPKSYVDYLIVNREQEREYLVISPYLLQAYNVNTVFEPFYFKDLISISPEHPEGKYFHLEDDMVKGSTDEEAYTFDDIDELRAIHAKAYESLSNYHELYVETNDVHPCYYVSTDLHHLVNAYSFKHYLLSDQSLLEYITYLTMKTTITPEEYDYINKVLSSYD